MKIEPGVARGKKFRPPLHSSFIPFSHEEILAQAPITDHIFAMSSRLSRITIDPEICHGAPVVRGLRYPVVALLEYLAGGDSIEDVLGEFPDLERDDLLACIEFAASSLKLKSNHLEVA